MWIDYLCYSPTVLNLQPITKLVVGILLAPGLDSDILKIRSKSCWAGTCWKKFLSYGLFSFFRDLHCWSWKCYFCILFFEILEKSFRSPALLPLNYSRWAAYAGFLLGWSRSLLNYWQCYRVVLMTQRHNYNRNKWQAKIEKVEFFYWFQ